MPSTPTSTLVPLRLLRGTTTQLIEYLEPRMARWWLPSKVEFIDDIPKTSTGKLSKRTLRDRYADVTVD